LIDWIIGGGWIVLCCIYGPAALLFARPIPRTRALPKSHAKRKANRTVRDFRTVQPKAKKSKTEKAKPWYTAPPFTDQEKIWYANYRMKRDGVGRVGNGGSVPI
jgi:hypothetical protein